MAKQSTPKASPSNGTVGKSKYSRAELRDKMPKSVIVEIGGQKLPATIKEFSTGSLGYSMNAKVTLEIDGEPVHFQAGLNLTAVNSKPA